MQEQELRDPDHSLIDLIVIGIDGLVDLIPLELSRLTPG